VSETIPPELQKEARRICRQAGEEDPDAPAWMRYVEQARATLAAKAAERK
jgi:hypothetical protein